MIVHPSNDSEIDKQTIARIFLGKVKPFLNGTPVSLISHDDGSEIAELFNDRVLNRSSSQLKAYWSKLLFTGRGTPPTAVANDQKMLERVARDPTSIGYIEGAPGDQIKVIAVF